MRSDWPVLILDGERDAGYFVRYALVVAGWDARRVQWTSSLAGARSHLRRGTPRVIVTTPTLPDAPDEQALFEVLREEAPDVPIVGIGPSTANYCIRPTARLISNVKGIIPTPPY